MISFVYTDYVEFNSSVLDQAYYNKNTKHLLVDLNNGVSAGYEGVSEGVWNNFKREEELGGSAGSFWNRMIKSNFTGFDTTSIDDWSSLEDEVYERDNYGYTDESFFNPTPAVPHVDISEAAPNEAPEVDAPSAPRAEDFPEGTPSRAAYDFVEQGGVKDVTAGTDLGQRCYEVTYEVRTTQTKVIYAFNDVAAEEAFNVPGAIITDVKRVR